MTLTITEGGSERTEILSTAAGAANYLLTSTYDGLVTLSATLGGLESRAGVLSAPTFQAAIAGQGLARVTYDNDTLRAGSVFLLLVRNLSNRSFTIDQIRIGYRDRNNNQFVQLPGSPLSPSTNPEATSGGDLTASEFTSIGYQLDNDIEANLYEIVYDLSDRVYGPIGSFTGRFDFAAP